MTAKKQKLLYCACARTRERGRILIFSQSKFGAVDFRFTLLSISTFERSLKTTRCFVKSEPSFYEKQHVVLWKTTRHFVENKPSFCESLMHFRTDKTDYLEVLRWEQLNFLWFHPWPLARKRPIHPRLRGKNGLYVWQSTLSTRWFVPMFQHEQKTG